MKKQLLFILITITSLNCFAQIIFEKGYYIDNSNQKVECLIKNVDWKNNPTQFTYKPLENGEQKTVTIESIKEFGIYNESKYIRYIINIDRSSNYLNELSNVKKPIFNKEELFLKVLVEGKANLYSFEDENLNRYFFNKDTSAIEQLIFKKFAATKNRIGVNNGFKQQLWVNLKCKDISLRSIENIDYTRKELFNFFIQYNECYDSEFISFEDKQNQDSFNLTIRPGFNSTSLSTNNRSSNIGTDFGNKLGFRLGVEAEFILPFNKNKWALLIEPTYQYFKSEKEASFGIRHRYVDYESIEMPIGIRHFLFLNNNSKAFVNGSFVLDFSGKSEIDNLKIRTGFNLAFGLGYKYNNKYSLELRYFTDRDLFYNYQYWESNYNTLSVIFGYTIL